jgi:hypothetical protein
VADGIGVADVDGMSAGSLIAGAAVGLAVGVTVKVAEGVGDMTVPGGAVVMDEGAGVTEGAAPVLAGAGAGCGAFPPPVTDSPVPWVPCTMAETGRPAAYSAAVSTPRVTTAIPAAVAAERTMILRLASFLPRACGDGGRPVRLVRALAAARSMPRSYRAVATPPTAEASPAPASVPAVPMNEPRTAVVIAARTEAVSAGKRISLGGGGGASGNSVNPWKVC